jgi:hypothetical protein
MKSDRRHGSRRSGGNVRRVLSSPWVATGTKLLYFAGVASGARPFPADLRRQRLQDRHRVPARDAIVSSVSFDAIVVHARGSAGARRDAGTWCWPPLRRELLRSSDDFQHGDQTFPDAPLERRAQRTVPRSARPRPRFASLTSWGSWLTRRYSTADSVASGVFPLGSMRPRRIAVSTISRVVRGRLADLNTARVDLTHELPKPLTDDL